MKFIYYSIFCLFGLISCSRTKSTNNLEIGFSGSDSLKNSIVLKEQDLKRYYQDLMEGRIQKDTLPDKLINSLLKEYQMFFKMYPKDTNAPYFIDKIHQLFTQEKRYTYAVDWVDTLMYHYPNYRNKSLTLYSAASSADMYLLDTNRVKRYYNRMLNECPKLKVEIKQQITHRLKYLSIPYIEYLVKKETLK